MTYYHQEILRIRDEHYANQGQLDTVIGARHYIDNHFDKGLNLALLSKVRFTSKFHLLRLFKRYYGQTPKQYLIDRRMEQAMRLLRDGMSITDTCFETGCECVSTFSTQFKARTGLAPTEFQKRATFTKSA